MNQAIQRILQLTGYEIRRIQPPQGAPTGRIGDNNRPVGRMDTLLEDLRERGLRCETILDVGANSGGWSRMAKHIYPDARFCLIEPQVEMQEKLEQFCLDFPGSLYVLAGAGPKTEELVLTVWPDLMGSSFLPHPNPDLLVSNQQRRIEIVTIDELIGSGKIQVPTLIKLDIQGFELEALKGETQTFGHTEVYLLEVSLFAYPETPGAPVISDIISFMLARDYMIYDFAGFARRPLDGALGQCDICFVKQNGFLRKSYA